MVSYGCPLVCLRKELGLEEPEELLNGYIAGQFLFLVIFFFQSACEN